MNLAVDNNLIQATVGNLYNFSNLHIGSFTYAQILDLLPGVGPDPVWNVIKLIAISLTIIFIALLIRIIVKMNKLMGPKIDLAKELLPPEPAKSALNARWEEILKHINSTREAEWKFAVIEADKMVEELLKEGGFAGETMGEKLMNMDKSQLVTLDSLWEAHKIRNRLVHDANYFLRYTEAKRAIGLYEKTLKELQAL